jgi:hypothetical protein
MRFVESRAPIQCSIVCTLRDFGFRRRKLYDVINVLSAIGCCQRNGTDFLMWTGLSTVHNTFYKLQKEAHADSPDVTLNEIVGHQHDVSISGLTVAFMLCFLGLHKSRLDIKHVSRYLARQSGRAKTTLCKLYQIANILEAAGVLERSLVPREVAIVSHFFAPIKLIGHTETTPPKSLYSLEALLIHVDSVKERALKKRAQEFLAVLGPLERAELLESGRFD